MCADFQPERTVAARLVHATGRVGAGQLRASARQSGPCKSHQLVLRRRVVSPCCNSGRWRATVTRDPLQLARRWGDAAPGRRRAPIQSPANWSRGIEAVTRVDVARVLLPSVSCVENVNISKIYMQIIFQ